MSGVRQFWDKWRGCDSIAVQNAWLHVRIVPELGGRILEYQLGDHAFLWCNPTLEIILAAEDTGQWKNWGGDKVWLAPQGWDSDTQWAGPPDPVLDGGRFRATVHEGSADTHVQLTSQPDRRSGMQISRTLKFRPNTTRVDITCTMTNIDSRTRRWGLWPVTQIDAASRRSVGMNRTLRACVPTRKNSAYDLGYRVIYGDITNPQYNKIDGTLEVSYQHQVGKIGADSDAGWVAVIDGETGSAFIMQMTFDPHAEHPDGSSLEIWTNGLGILKAYGRTEHMPDSLDQNPYMLECELVSPFAELAPGESYQFTYTWAATNIGADGQGHRSIRTCNAIACEVEPFTIAETGELSGRFGTFYAGQAFLEFVDDQQNVIRRQFVADATPLEPILLQGVVTIPAAVRRVILVLDASDDAHNAPCLGEIAHVDVRHLTGSR